MDITRRAIGTAAVGGIAVASAGIAKLLFFIFLVLFVISLIFGWRGKRVP